MPAPDAPSLFLRLVSFARVSLPLATLASWYTASARRPVAPSDLMGPVAELVESGRVVAFDDAGAMCLAFTPASLAALGWVLLDDGKLGRPGDKPKARPKRRRGGTKTAAESDLGRDGDPRSLAEVASNGRGGPEAEDPAEAAERAEAAPGPKFLAPTVLLMGVRAWPVLGVPCPVCKGLRLPATWECLSCDQGGQDAKLDPTTKARVKAMRKAYVPDDSLRGGR